MPTKPQTLLIAMRLHQWLKNILVFVPLLTAHQALDTAKGLAATWAFLAFSLCASSTYLLNDLIDLPHDREHRTKSSRPIAAGDLSIPMAGALAVALMASGLTVAFSVVNRDFASVLVGYVVMTIAYSLALRRLALVDVFALGGFYALRVAAGAAAVQVPVSAWLLAFCLFFFLSLAFLKRCVELHGGEGDAPVGGRVYTPTDLALLRSMGITSGYASIVVLALYIQDQAIRDLYPSPAFLWIGAAALLYWLSRIWFLGQRGAVHEDPVLFAVTDRVSLLVGAVVGLSAVLAAVVLR